MGKIVGMVLMLAFLVLFCGKISALELCDMNIEDGLMECKPSVTKLNPTDPTVKCCEALSGANLTCLCGYSHSYLLPSLGIDPDLARALPAKCSLTPPNNC